MRAHDFDFAVEKYRLLGSHLLLSSSLSSFSVKREDRHPCSGRKFSAHESPYNIKYSATDRLGHRNEHLCSFFINVKGK